jgi:hypothetical protein
MCFVAVALFSATALMAQQTKKAASQPVCPAHKISANKISVEDVSPAPVSAQILAAKRVFISNAGTDLPYTDFLGHNDTDYTYNRFYAGMKDWGRFELTATPVDADIVLEIGYSYLLAFSERANYRPSLKLVILDPKAHVALWTLIEEAPSAILQFNRDRNVEAAMNKLLTRTKCLVEQPASSGSSNK